MIAQFTIEPVKCLGYHANIPQNRHKISVSVPPRDDMDVQVIRKSRAGAQSEINAQIEPVRREDSGQEALGIAQSRGIVVAEARGMHGSDAGHPRRGFLLA